MKDHLQYCLSLLIALSITIELKPMQQALKLPAGRALMAKKMMLAQTPITLIGHEGQVISANFSADDQKAVTSAEGKSNNIIIWDKKTGQKLKAFTVSSDTENSEYKNIHAYPNHDCSKIIIDLTKKSYFNTQKFFETNIDEQKHNINDKTDLILLLDAETGKQHNLTQPSDNYEAMYAEFSNNGTRIILKTTKNNESTISIFDSSTNKKLHTYKFNTANIDFRLNPEKNTAIISNGKKFILYDLSTGKLVKTLEGPSGDCNVYNIVHSADGTRMAYANPIKNDDDSQDVFIWDGETGKTIKKLNFDYHYSLPITLSPDGTVIFMLNYVNRTIDMKNIDTEVIVATFTVIDIGSSQPCCNTSGTMLATLLIVPPFGESESLAIKINIWDTATGYSIKSIILDKKHTSYESLKFSQDSTKISYGFFYNDKYSKILCNIDTEEIIKEFTTDHECTIAVDQNLSNVIYKDETNNHNFILWRTPPQKVKAPLVPTQPIPTPPTAPAQTTPAQKPQQTWGSWFSSGDWLRGLR